MVRLEEDRASSNTPIEILSSPPKVYIPLIQHTGKSCDRLEVKIGDTVTAGQKLATAEAKVFAPIHASISGKITSVQPWPHPVLGRCETIVIENNNINTADTRLNTQDEVAKLSAERIRDIVFESGIVGMGGASFPTHIKLNPPKPVDTLIVNGAECEPYVTCDSRLMVEKTQEIISGIALVAKCLRATKVYIAIEDNKPQAIAAFQGAAGATAYAVRILKSQYPQGGEKQLIKNILNKEVPRGKLPFDIGVSVQNVATIFAVYEAAYKNKPLYERTVTVTGSCISNPKNFLARIGTPIKELIKACGLKEEPAKIIIGGPMMGITQFSDEVPVIKSTNAIILMNKFQARELEETFCIRCGACVRECPAGLMPCLINLASGKELWPESKNYGAADCIECGICNYVCPANRRLVQSIKRAKLEAIK
jgi:electron transport complex protein RnfC